MNSIYHKLKHILEFFIETGEYEDIIDLEKSYKIYFTNSWNPDIEYTSKGIEIIDETANHIKIVLQYSNIDKWISIVSYQNGRKDRGSIELDFIGPEDLALTVFTDENIKKFLPEEFYKFLIELKEEYVKVEVI